MNKREMSVSGSFYPDKCSEIARFINNCNASIETEHKRIKVKAVISPHAGYMYSGFCANAAFSRIDPNRIKRVILIGPSHRVYIKGASVAMYANYCSPCGDLHIDLNYSRDLIEKYAFLSFVPSAHQEHSTETQVPFIQHYFKDPCLVEIIYGDMDYTELVPLIKKIIGDEENLLVISTDLSHFYPLKEANIRDKICLEGVESMDAAKLASGCEACGIIGLKAVLKTAKQLGMQSEIIDYRTSYDSSLDDTRVVGYMSALIF